MFQPMEEIEHNGPGFKYQVTYQKIGFKDATISIDNWRNNSVEIDADEPYFPYNVKIQAKNNEGDSRGLLQNHILYSYEDSENSFTFLLEIRTCNII